MNSIHYILCLNSGSSSLKYALYRMGREDETLLAQGSMERIGLDGGRMSVRTGMRADAFESKRDFQDHRAAVDAAFHQVEDLRLARPTAVGHRVVHGGLTRFEPARVDKELVAELKNLVGFAPLHLPSQIEGIEAVAGYYPELPQVACFDTAFHRRMPELAQLFPLPKRFWEEGLRRYGFHGLSYEYVLSALGVAAVGRVLIAHLGNGASMAAIRDGRPIDTTMGLTPTGGFMMGTRSGDLDPGVLLYLMNEKGYTRGQIEDLVDKQAGLLGVSGISPDMRTLLSRREHDSNAALAIDLFCYHVRKHIGAMAATLGGLDTLVFTGGIGEKAAPVRSAVCHGLGFLGITLDEGRNATNADPVSSPGSGCTVRIIPTNEDLIIARHTFGLLAQRQRSL
ncbi:MAG: acetate/propionate family kinase [Acidobacteriia bacterium]|nr:acetate/propionate family kinase [Terriglobia bacterium]